MVVDNPTHIEGIRVINDPTEIFEELIKGHEVYHWEAGESMAPILNHMEYCRLTPITDVSHIKPGDAVFCKIDVNGKDWFMVHMVTMVSDCANKGEKHFQIGSTSGEVYGWTKDIYATAHGTGIFQKEIHKKPWWQGF